MLHKKHRLVTVLSWYPDSQAVQTPVTSIHPSAAQLAGQATTHDPATALYPSRQSTHWLDTLQDLQLSIAHVIQLPSMSWKSVTQEAQTFSVEHDLQFSTSHTTQVLLA